MSINIKEIFQSDNLSLSQDKINYNFDQILANGGGPQGLKGDKGTTGALGSIGPKGDKGEIGSAGPKGNTGADGYWDLETYINPIDQHTLIPKIQPTSGSTTGDKPTNIVLGRTNSSYTENAIDKSSLLTLVDENGGSDWTNLINFRLKTGASFNPASINIRLVPINAGSGAKLRLLADGGSSAEFEIQTDVTAFKDNSGNTILNLQGGGAQATGYWGFLAGSEININATGVLNNNGNSNLLGNNVLGASGKTNTITGTTTINGAALKINTTGSLPAANKILVAQDTDGTSLWKKPTDVMGIYPVGSILFVNPADISDTNFWITTYLGNTQLSATSGYNWSYFGRGKENTKWAGWYLLFGQTNAWYLSGSATKVTSVPTNIPGSLIMGASGPDNKLGVIQNVYDSSMTTPEFNPPVGYGSSYLPSIRGGYDGNGAQGVTGPGTINNPGDLLNAWGYGTGYATNYDVLDAVIGAQGGVLNDMSYNLANNGNAIYPKQPAIHALPMAIYLGSTTLIYNYQYYDYSISPAPSGG
jgi:hypothetical protein